MAKKKTFVAGKPLRQGFSKEEIEEMQKNGDMFYAGNSTKDYAKLYMTYTPNTEGTFIQREDEIVILNISDLSPSPKNNFRLPTGEKREEFLASLSSETGQINPIIVRPKEYVEAYQDQIENKYEILQGHSRVDCLKELGEKTVKAVIKYCDDVTATLHINQSNIQREDTTELEKALAYKETYLALKKDKKSNLKNVEISTDLSKGQSVPSREDKKRTLEIVAEMYGLNYKTLERKMALAFCHKGIVKLYEKGKINQGIVVTLSKMVGNQEEIMEGIEEAVKEKRADYCKEFFDDAYEEYKRIKKSGKNGTTMLELNDVRRLIRSKNYLTPKKEKTKKVEKVEKVKEKPIEKKNEAVDIGANQTKYIIPDILFPKDVTDKQGWIVRLLQDLVDGKIKIVKGDE